MKKLINLLPLLALMLVVQSCSDVLSRTEPTTSITQKKALNTPGGIKTLRTGMFAYFHSLAWSTTYMLCPEGKADDIFNRQGTNRLSGCTHNNKGATSYIWSSFNNDGTPNTGDTGGGSFNIINQANLLINGIPDGVLAADKKKQFVGEAHFIRAFVYHQMVRALGYEPGMQPDHGTGVDWNLGAPIVTKPTLSTKDAEYHPRKTVLKVYKLIISDLKTAIQDLAGNSVGSPYYPSKAAAEAELARVYLYAAGDQQNFPDAYKNANKYAKAAIADAKSLGAEVVPSSGVATMFNESAGVNPGGIWVVKFTSLTTLGLNNSLAAYTSKGWMANMPTQDLINLYSKNDARLAWFSPCYDEYNGEKVTNCPATSPYIPAAHGTSGLELDKWIGDAGNFADDVPYLRMAEQLLIETEARLKGAPGDPLGPINELRTNRGLTKLTSVNMEDVLKARRREFVGEGMRFWDLKRLGKTIVKAPNSLGVSDVPYESFLNIAPIPSSDVVQSQQRAPKDSVLIQNPCYDGYTGSAPCP